MAHPLETIKNDLATMPPRDFYKKYILRSECWYFEKILTSHKKSSAVITDDFKEIISSEMRLNFNDVALVGSAKLGYSLAPKNNFSEFRTNGDGRPESDIDIAIISSDIFHHYWDLLRNSFKIKYTRHYHEKVYKEIFFGHINEKTLNKVEGCVAEWNDTAARSKIRLQNDLYIQHSITYRIYRSWLDLEKYQLWSLGKLKQGEIK